ncbi:MAG: hypothetical protein F6K54_31990 [Okeania sp. SIO3B5]|uniref:hypothetical protein n=1 Tax=Okeania sp. SIO3B5 TaxID=2607811 RepID=UPI0013FF2982|nr:hypothetical protein [Okeania sp. SIO3B5]NEO57287.1 hypothetical protein [Okeania sp. SIO3B5]
MSRGFEQGFKNQIANQGGVEGSQKSEVRSQKLFLSRGFEQGFKNQIANQGGVERPNYFDNPITKMLSDYYVRDSILICYLASGSISTLGSPKL